MSWFGPLGVYSHEAPRTTFLDRILEIMSLPWFFGDIERVESEQFLLDNATKRGIIIISIFINFS